MQHDDYRMLVWLYLFDRIAPQLWQLVTAAVVIAASALHTAGDPHHMTIAGGIAGVIGLFSFSGFFFFNSKIARHDGPECIQGAVSKRSNRYLKTDPERIASPIESGEGESV